MGGMMAPVDGSGDWPAWMTRVARWLLRGMCWLKIVSCVSG